MTICISVKVGEGLVLAADSAAAVEGALIDPKRGIEEHGILKIYDHARKLSHIKDYPIGTLTWGLALIGSRSVESLIKEYEYCLPSVEEELEKARIQRLQGNEIPKFTYSVNEIARGLYDHVKKFYDATFSSIPAEAQPHLGILVSGYSSGEFFPEQWLIEIPAKKEIVRRRPDLEGKPQFGADWFGLTDAITRLHWGRDDGAIPLLAEKFKLDPGEVAEVLSHLQYPIIFDGMPLQDAIDFAVYLVNVAIGRFRFVIGTELCGGEIDVAVITPNNFQWIKRKSWRFGNS